MEMLTIAVVRKTFKKMEHFKTFYGPLSQEWIDRRY